MNLESQISDALAARASLAPAPSPDGPDLSSGHRSTSLLVAGALVASAFIAIGFVIARQGEDELGVVGPASSAASEESPATTTPATSTTSTVAVTATVPVAPPSTSATLDSASSTSTPTTTRTPTTTSRPPGTPPPATTVASTQPPIAPPTVEPTATPTSAVPELVFPTTVPPPPVAECGAPSGPAPSAEGIAPTGDPALDAVRRAIVGRWVGAASVPAGWLPIGTVWVEFRADGTYRGWCIDVAAAPVFYYAENCDCSLNRYDVYDLNSDGSATADIDLAWFDDSSATRGTLTRIVVEGNRLTFEFWHGGYGPVTYSLTRAPG